MIKDAALIILSLFVISLLMLEAYERGYNDGYDDAIAEENIYSCEVIT